MIKFNNLYITPNGESLVIDVSVLDLPYYDSISIGSIYVDTQDTYVSTGPSEKAIQVYSSTQEQSATMTKDVSLVLDKGNFTPSLKDNLFFVYVKAIGTPSSDTPCGMDNTYTLGTVLYKCPIYNHMMSSIKNLNNDCSIPMNFINSYLRFKALELSIQTNHYVEAINFYNKYIKKAVQESSIINTCNCHG